MTTIRIFITIWKFLMFCGHTHAYIYIYIYISLCECVYAIFTRGFVRVNLHSQKFNIVICVSVRRKINFHLWLHGHSHQFIMLHLTKECSTEMPIRCDRERYSEPESQLNEWKSIYKIFIMRFQAGMLFLIVLVKWHICLLCGTLTDYHSVEYSVAYLSLYFI